MKGVEEELVSVKRQLGSVQEELSKMGQLFLKFFEKGMGGLPGDPHTKGDVLDAAMAGPSLGGPLLTKTESNGGDKNRKGPGPKAKMEVEVWTKNATELTSDRVSATKR